MTVAAATHHAESPRPNGGDLAIVTHLVERDLDCVWVMICCSAPSGEVLEGCAMFLPDCATHFARETCAQAIWDVLERSRPRVAAIYTDALEETTAALRVRRGARAGGTAVRVRSVAPMSRLVPLVKAVLDEGMDITFEAGQVSPVDLAERRQAWIAEGQLYASLDSVETP